MATKTANLEAGERTLDLAQDRQTSLGILIAFQFTFVAARLLALLIMPDKIPDLILGLDGPHVDHPGCGILLPSAALG